MECHICIIHIPYNNKLLHIWLYIDTTLPLYDGKKNDVYIYTKDTLTT